MDLTPAECRVLGCLIETAAADPDAYPPTLNALRLACNRPTDRVPVVAYDDRTVEDTLLSLKSKGLARFLPAPRGERRARYGHRADERWRMGPAELAVLAVLLLGGPLTVSEVRARAQRLHPFARPSEVDAVLDSLAARTPMPFAARLPGPDGSHETRWTQVLTGPPPEALPGEEPAAVPATVTGGTPARTELAPSYAELVRRVAELERRLAASLERLTPSADWPGAPPPPPPPPGGDEGFGGRAPVGSGPAADRALPSGERPAYVRELADRVSDMERRLARIEAELGALR